MTPVPHGLGAARLPAARGALGKVVSTVEREPVPRSTILGELRDGSAFTAIAAELAIHFWNAS
jgi:hypothetical protein